MKEIGGYFELENTHGTKEYYKDLIALNFARNAVSYVCKARHIKKLYIPFFLCESISDICKRDNIEIEYYHINELFMPIFNKVLKDSEYLYLVNYYGQIENRQIQAIIQQFKNVIVDNVQAFFQEPLLDVDTVYSCRKFFGVPDGAYLSTKYIIKENFPEDDSSNRLKHIYGRSTGSASEYFNDYRDLESKIDKEPIKKMSSITHSLLKDIDYDFVKKQRQLNYKILHRELSEMNKLHLIIPEGPFAYPLFVENGSIIRKKLIENKIYVPLLWPNVKEGNEGEMAANILPLPCDQRYSEKDMLNIVKIIRTVRKKYE